VFRDVRFGVMIWNEPTNRTSLCHVHTSRSA